MNSRLYGLAYRFLDYQYASNREFLSDKLKMVVTRIQRHIWKTDGIDVAFYKAGRSILSLQFVNIGSDEHPLIFSDLNESALEDEGVSFLEELLNAGISSLPED